MDKNLVAAPPLKSVAGSIAWPHQKVLDPTLEECLSSISADFTKDAIWVCAISRPN